MSKRGSFQISPAISSSIQDNTMEILDLNMDQIVINPNQPRTDNLLDDEQIKELSINIKKVGLINPIVVRDLDSNHNFFDKKYILVSGHRRFMACKLLNMQSIKASRFLGSEKQAYVQSFYENTMRKNMSVLDIGRSYCKMINEYGYTLEEVSEKEGKAESYTRMIRYYIKIATNEGILVRFLKECGMSVDDIKDHIIMNNLISLLLNNDKVGANNLIDMINKINMKQMTVGDVRKMSAPSNIANVVSLQDKIPDSYNKSVNSPIYNGFLVDKSKSTISIKYVGSGTREYRKRKLDELSEQIKGFILNSE